jgi:hypothetical protein
MTNIPDELVQLQTSTYKDFSETLSRLRSVASQLRFEHPEADEEKLFQDLLGAISKGVTRAFMHSVGVSKTTKLLDPFNGKVNKKTDY